MKLFLSAILITCIACSAFAQELVLHSTVEADFEAFKKIVDFTTVEFKTSAKKEIGRYFSYDLSEIILPIIKEVPLEYQNSIVIMIEDEAGAHKSYTFYDFDPEINNVTPRILYEQARGSVGDTVEISDLIDQKGIVDLAQVQAEMDQAVDERVYLPIKKISKAEKAKYFSMPTVIIPKDTHFKRWVPKVKAIRIFYIKN